MRTVIVTADKSSAIGDGLTYEAPEHARAGMLVRVPLRKRWVEGLIVGPETEVTTVTARAIGVSLDASPLLSPASIATAQWMAKHYRCTLRQALGVFLPFSPWSSILPPTERVVRITEKKSNVRGEKQRAILDLLRTRAYRREELLAESGASASTLASLKKAGWIMEETRVKDPTPIVFKTMIPPTLTPAQRVAFNAVNAARRPVLLFGVTGSGKTEIYAELIRQCVEGGGRAIVLVPEIFLSEQAVVRYRTLLGDDAVAVLHSKLTPAQRRDVLRRCRAGAVRLVLGSRSALFAPLPDLKLVVIDEEHEWTYKSEQAPRYHARETAEELCRHAGAKLVLGSATPSAESWHRCESGRYTMVRLTEKYGDVVAPNVRVIDLTDVRFGNAYPFSGPLLEAIHDRLKRKEQSVLFLNRRGLASAMLCLDCRRRLVNIHSGMPYTLHNDARGRPVLVDHVSGETRDVPEHCPGCGSVRMHAVGAGTHRAELILKEHFPAARILRADSDALATPEAMRSVLAQMRDGSADILVGTQSVVKGLDFPRVTLAAVLVADIGLSLPHFRAGERVFQMLMQLIGRSGRHKPGDVIIQTFRPDAEEVVKAAAADVEGYLNDEVSLRTKLHYPPAAEMIRLLWRDAGARDAANAVHAALLRRIGETNAPAFCSRAPSLFGGGREWHVLLRGAKIAALLDGVDVHDASIDVDPIECC